MAVKFNPIRIFITKKKSSENGKKIVLVKWPKLSLRISNFRVLIGVGKLIQSTTTFCRFSYVILEFFQVLRSQKLGVLYFEHKLGHNLGI